MEKDTIADATTSDEAKPEEVKDVEEAKEKEEATDAMEKCVSHIRNDVHSPFVRWGVLTFLIGTLILLAFADFGSGVTAESIAKQDGEVYETTTILNVSVVSSVGKLWEAESYPLAIFIAITSIGWPYIKLGLATMAWVTPYANPRRREFFIEIIDALGKWSFVDIMVLVEIMVAFRSSLLLAPGLTVDIVIVAQWGFYGFVVATMLSLASTHVILHYHRKVHYHQSTDTTTSGKAGIKELGKLSNGFIIVALASIFVSMALFIAGVIVESFEVTSTRGATSVTTAYSIASIGTSIPGAYIDPDHAGTRFIQFMWFFLGVATPLLCSALFFALYAIPSLSKSTMEVIFASAEITFAWSCAEVLFISTVFAVKQMPVFGDGLVQSNCVACFLVDTKILPQFWILCVGTILNVGVNVWLYRKAHGIIYLQSTQSSE